MASSTTSTYNSPCAACKFLRRKCLPGCIFAPYFPPEEPQKFANVHKIFGASNVTKLLNELLPHQREDAVNSLAYEAEARVKDPVYGCVSAITFLQRQVQYLQKQLDSANADLIRLTCSDHHLITIPTTPTPSSFHQNGVMNSPLNTRAEYGGAGGGGGGGGIDHTSFYYQNPINVTGFNNMINNNAYAPLPWSSDNYSGGLGNQAGSLSDQGRHI